MKIHFHSSRMGKESVVKQTHSTSKKHVYWEKKMERKETDRNGGKKRGKTTKGKVIWEGNHPLNLPVIPPQYPTPIPTHPYQYPPTLL